MPYRKHIAELDLRIEKLRKAIGALRIGSASRTEIDRALSELARVKAERVRLMLRQANFSSARARRQATGTLPSEPGKP